MCRCLEAIWVRISMHMRESYRDVLKMDRVSICVRAVRNCCERRENKNLRQLEIQHWSPTTEIDQQSFTEGNCSTIYQSFTEGNCRTSNPSPRVTVFNKNTISEGFIFPSSPFLHHVSDSPRLQKQDGSPRPSRSSRVPGLLPPGISWPRGDFPRRAIRSSRTGAAISSRLGLCRGSAP